MCDHAYLRLMLEYGLDLELYITSDIIRNHFFGEMLMCEDKKVAENCMLLVALYLRSNELRASSQGLEVLSKFDALKHKFQLVDQTQILESPNSLKNLTRLKARQLIALKTKQKHVAFPYAVESSDMTPEQKNILLFKDFE